MNDLCDCVFNIMPSEIRMRFVLRKMWIGDTREGREFYFIVWNDIFLEETVENVTLTTRNCT